MNLKPVILILKIEKVIGNQIKVLWSYTSSGSELNIFYYIIYIEDDNYR